MVETKTKRIGKTQRYFAQNMRDVEDFFSSDQIGLALEIQQMGTQMWGEGLLSDWLARYNEHLKAAPIVAINQGEQGQQQVADMLGRLKERNVVLN